MDKKEEGMEGEKLAAGYLEDLGYSILDKNFHTRYGEIDLIARDNNGEIIFVEVKTRRAKSFGYPEEAVDERKIKKMLKTANIWLDGKNQLDSEWRMDIISIEMDSGTPKITHIQNITQEMDYTSDETDI
jgi:putative endonuclease